MAKLASLKAPPAGLKPPRRSFSHPSDKIGLDDPGMHPTFTAAGPFGKAEPDGAPSRTRDTGATQTYAGQVKFDSGPHSGGASGFAAPGLSGATQLQPSKIGHSTASSLSTYADTPEAARSPQPNAGAETEQGAAELSGPSPSRRSTSLPQSPEQNAAGPTSSAGQQPARLTPSVRTPSRTGHSTSLPEGNDTHYDSSSAPTLPMFSPAPSQPGSWEWASGQPLELGQLPPSAAAQLPHAEPAIGAWPHHSLIHGDKDQEGLPDFTASRRGPEISENASPTPALPIGPERRVAEEPEKHAPVLPIGPERRVAEEPGKHAPVLPIGPKRRVAEEPEKHAPVLPIGPKRRVAEKPEKQAPLLTIGTIEVSVVPPPAPTQAPATPLPPAVTVIRPTHSQPHQPALAWYGMAQT
jgi:hypothetical protein